MACLRPKLGPTEIAHGGETAHQGVAGLVSGNQVDVAGIRGRHQRGRRPHQHRVPVVVDQARHQRPATAVDDRGGRIGRQRLGGDPLDPVALDPHVRRCRQPIAVAVKDFHVPEVGRGHVVARAPAASEAARDSAGTAGSIEPAERVTAAIRARRTRQDHGQRPPTARMRASQFLASSVRAVRAETAIPAGRTTRGRDPGRPRP